MAALPPPYPELEVHWCGPRHIFEANLFTDGSGLHGRCPWRRRCGAGCASIDGDGAMVTGCFAALPGQAQTVPGAE
eukprot:307670-Lingulodinium_polyedra.AAC.1